MNPLNGLLASTPSALPFPGVPTGAIVTRTWIAGLVPTAAMSYERVTVAPVFVAPLPTALADHSRLAELMQLPAA